MIPLVTVSASGNHPVKRMVLIYMTKVGPRMTRQILKSDLAVGPVSSVCRLFSSALAVFFSQTTGLFY